MKHGGQWLGLSRWSIGAPLAAATIVPLTLSHLAVPSIIVATGLIGAVLAAVHHAEIVAHRVGEPFGTLLLALAVTLIEVSLIVVLMIGGTEGGSALARDTVFAAVMIILDGIIGLAMLIGGVRHGEQTFRTTGTSASLACLSALTVLTLVLPDFTTSVPGPYYSSEQLAFVAVVSAALYLTFVFVQTVRHREDFLSTAAGTEQHGSRPATMTTVAASVLLIVALVAVVLLGKALAASVKDSVEEVGLPQAVVAVMIALDRAVAGRDLGAPRRLHEPTADQPQSRAWLGTRLNRPDHSSGRSRCPTRRFWASARAVVDGHRAARAFAIYRVVVVGDRSLDGPAGRRSRHDLCRLSVHCRCTIISIVRSESLSALLGDIGAKRQLPITVPLSKENTLDRVRYRLRGSPPL